MDMRKVSAFDFNFYTKADRQLYNQTCSGKKCTNGLTNNGKWPVKEVCGERWQAYWCKFAVEGNCTTFYCVDCGQDNLEREEANNIKLGRRGRRVRTRGLE